MVSSTEKMKPSPSLSTKLREDEAAELFWPRSNSAQLQGGGGEERLPKVEGGGKRGGTSWGQKENPSQKQGPHQIPHRRRRAKGKPPPQKEGKKKKTLTTRNQNPSRASISSPLFLKRLNCLVAIVLIYLLWRERNARLHGMPASTVSTVVFNTHVRVGAKLRNWKFKYSLPQFVQNSISFGHNLD